MNCLDDLSIQLYIDGELAQEQVDHINKHLEQCADCQTRLDHQKNLKSIITNKIRLADQESNIVPELPFPNQKTHRLKPLVKYIAISASLVASWLLFMWFPLSQKEKGMNDMLYYTMEFETDANQPISNMPMVMHEISADGNINEFYFE